MLNVAIPTILRDFDTTLPRLQWVITGYSLTFGALLIIGGRLADVYGARRLFVVGAALFGAGSLVAALSTGVMMLIVGEAVIEGVGASLMLPAALGILTSTFQGRERAGAFAAWGATIGTAVALGPTLGGFLTTDYSWRWAFVINVIVVPFAIVGAFLFMRVLPGAARRERIDVPGALLIASGMFLLVFGISEGGTYGWWRPLQDFHLGPWSPWPAERPVAMVPVAFALAAVLLSWFVVVERAKERSGRDPLFELGQLRHLRFRYGLATLIVLAMGQTAFLLVISVFLQDGVRLSALDAGVWLVPSGVFIVVGAQAGGRLTRRIGTVAVVRVGLALEAAGLVVSMLVIDPDVTFWTIFPGFALFGLGIGAASSQLTNVILSDIPPERSGAASGANSTVRMIGSSLGIAIMSSMLSVLTIRNATDAVAHTRQIGSAARGGVLGQIHHAGVNFVPRAGTSPHDASVLGNLIRDAIASASRPPLLFAAAAVTIGLLVSFLIPRLEAEPAEPAEAEEAREAELLAEATTIQ